MRISIIHSVIKKKKTQLTNFVFSLDWKLDDELLWVLTDEHIGGGGLSIRILKQSITVSHFSSIRILYQSIAHTHFSSIRIMKQSITVTNISIRILKQSITIAHTFPAVVLDTVFKVEK